MINPPLYTKWIATILLSLTAITLYLLNRKSKPRLYCMIAMLLCTCGDFFMTNSFHLNKMVTTAIGALSFIAGHLCYAYMFKTILKEKNEKLYNKGFIIGALVAIIPEIVLIILSYTIANPTVSILYALFIPVYVLVIGYHIASNFAYGYTLKNARAIVLALAVTLFYVTDIWIFLNMYHIVDIQDMVWHFYPLAQLLIIILCVPINAKELKEIKFFKYENEDDVYLEHDLCFYKYDVKTNNWVWITPEAWNNRLGLKNENTNETYNNFRSSLKKEIELSKEEVESLIGKNINTKEIKKIIKQ